LRLRSCSGHVRGTRRRVSWPSAHRGHEPIRLNPPQAPLSWRPGPSGPAKMCTPAARRASSKTATVPIATGFARRSQLRPATPGIRVVLRAADRPTNVVMFRAAYVPDEFRIGWLMLPPNSLRRALELPDIALTAARCSGKPAGVRWGPAPLVGPARPQQATPLRRPLPGRLAPPRHTRHLSQLFFTSRQRIFAIEIKRLNQAGQPSTGA
jgi:hypothetical protein